MKIILFSLLMLSVIQSITSITYNTFEYVPQNRFRPNDNFYSSISIFLMSSDQSKILMSPIPGPLEPQTSREIDLYTINRTDIKFVQSQIFSQSQNASSQLLIKSDKNMAIIATYAPLSKMAKIYKRTNFTLQLIDEFTPLPFSCNMMELSSDANFLVFGVTINDEVVSYQFNHNLTKYDLVYNLTLPYAATSMSMTPDGKYLVYGQIVSITKLNQIRIVKNDNTLTQVYSTSFSSTVAVTFARINLIRVSNPSPLVYDIAFQYEIDNLFSTAYFTFYSSTSTASPVQFIRTNRQNYQLDMLLTQNGKYLSILQNNFTSTATLSTLRVYEKQSSTYVQVYSSSRGVNDPKLFHMTEDGSLIVMRTNSTYRLTFLYQCSIINCEKCKWKGVCETCAAGLLLENNACKCPVGQYNLSGSCILCNVSNCIACSASNVCSGCKTNYTLSSGSCVCDSGKSINHVTGQCITCNVPNCYKCSYPDVCDVFLSSSSSTSQTQSMKSQIQSMAKQLKWATIAIITLASVILVLMFTLLCKLRNPQVSQSNNLTSSVPKSKQNLNSSILSTQMKQNVGSSTFVNTFLANNFILENQLNGSTIETKECKANKEFKQEFEQGQNNETKIQHDQKRKNIRSNPFDKLVHGHTKSFFE